jgi:hypothetical protein
LFLAVYLESSTNILYLTTHLFQQPPEFTEMAAPNVTALAARLRSTLKNSTIFTPDSEGYAKAIIRWSDEMEKRAVSDI